MFDEDALVRDALEYYAKRLRLDADLRSNRGSANAWWRKHLRDKAAQASALQAKYTARARRNDETRANAIRRAVS